MTWVCPKCGHTEQQPERVAEVAHFCPATRHHQLVNLEAQHDPR